MWRLMRESEMGEGDAGACLDGMGRAMSIWYEAEDDTQGPTNDAASGAARCLARARA